MRLLSGFGLKKLNNILKEDIFIEMRNFVVKCCELMNDESISFGNLLPNHEDKIKLRLMNKYLRQPSVRETLGFKNIRLMFDAETVENYNEENDGCNARLDIKVSSEDTLTHYDKYFTIECKRLDGYAHLNKEYVKEGVSRFVSPGAKYASGYGKNLMLGFIVRDIDLKENATKINQIQKVELPNEIKEELLMLEEIPLKYCIYRGMYSTNFGEIQLQHLFYNLSKSVG